MNKFFLLVMVCLLPFTDADAQTKFEREYRITLEDVPKRALDFIDSCSFPNNVKWYAEESQAGSSVEAKIRHRKTLFSIEFDTLGKVLDVERKVRFDRLDPDLMNRLSSALNGLFTRYKITKTQVQFTGPRQVLIDLILNRQPDSTYTVRYELELAAKKNGLSSNYEILMDPEGNVLEMLEIIQNNTDNLEF